MNYINKTTLQYPISEQDIRNLNPNTSFSTPFVAPSEYALVFASPQPEFNQVTQTARELQPELTSKGNYEQRWEVVSKFVEYTDEQGIVHTVAEQEQAAIAKDSAEKAEQIQKEIVDSTQQRLDTFAKTRNYDSILSACTYATSTVLKFQAEGQYCVDARDSTWSKLYQILEEVKQGIRPAPSGFADIEPDLPVLTWPN